uniref:Uncharacterized protein n=1 Tax=Parascaris equorum TaxID=6256 RepID=A0A914RR39_PAREQ
MLSSFLRNGTNSSVFFFKLFEHLNGKGYRNINDIVEMLRCIMSYRRTFQAFFVLIRHRSLPLEIEIS